VHRERKGASDGVVHLLTLQDLDDVEEQKGRLILTGEYG
jgi:hypothetical protein